MLQDASVPRSVGAGGNYQRTGAVMRILLSMDPTPSPPHRGVPAGKGLDFVRQVT